MSGTVFLILSIASSTLINVIFKLFALRNINKLSAIVMNYFTCFALGIVLSGNSSISSHLEHRWFLYAISLGAFFVLIFFLMATTTEKLGISVNAVSSKMSVVIPLVLAFLLFKEDFNILFGIGLSVGLFSIYLISVRKEIHLNRHYILLPIAVFLGSGFIDFSLKWMEESFSSQTSLEAISYSIFLGAALCGSIVLLVRYVRVGLQFSWKNSLAGILLGIPNYFSILFLLKALQYFNNNSALVFSLNNVSIVLLSSVISILIFKEKLNAKNKWGLILASVAIGIISYAKG